MNPGLFVAAAVIISSGISGFVGFVIAKNDPTASVKLVSPQPDMPMTSLSPTLIPPETKKPSIGLQNAVSAVLEGTSGTYAVYIKNLNTKESYTQNEHYQFTAASLYKLWIMGEAFTQIKSGKLDKNETLSRSVSALNSAFNIPPDQAESTSGTVTMTVAQAIERMITVSHNYAALLLADRLGSENVRDFLGRHQFTKSTFGGSSLTTATDVGNFFEKLYLGQISDSDSSDQMLTVFKKQALNDKLPKYLPQGTAIAHKTGELDNVTHDAGIVYSPSDPYIIIVLTQSDSPPGANERISKISEAVYNYFNPK